MVLRAKVEDKVMDFHRMEVGKEFPELHAVFDEELQGRFLISAKEENPWYSVESPWGGPITYHPLMDDAPMEAAMQCYQYPFGFVHARQETEFINPLPLGKPARIRSKVVDKYEKRGKGYIVIESLVVDEDGVEIMRSRNHAMIDDERVREASKSGLLHVPASISTRYGKRTEESKP